MDARLSAQGCSAARGIARITPLAVMAGLAAGAVALLANARPARAPARSDGAASPTPPARLQPARISVRVDPHDALGPGADLSGIILTGASLIGIDGGIDLHGSRLRRTCLWKCDFRGANLEGCDLRDAILLACRLDGASLRGVKLDRAELCYTDRNYNDPRIGPTMQAEGDRENASFSSNLRGADLTGASLVDARLADVVLDGARMQSAALRGAQLNSTHLNGADLRGADLSAADFWCCAELRRANLDGARAPNARLNFAALDGASLRGADLRGADLTKASLPGADLCRANLSHASLHYADLTHASLKGADLRGADLTRSDLTGADLTGADLRGADLAEACYDRHTRWPVGSIPELAVRCAGDAHPMAWNPSIRPEMLHGREGDNISVHSSLDP